MGNRGALDRLAPEEAKRRQSNGGKKSGETRRRKREFRKMAEAILNLRPKEKKKLLREWDELGYDVEAEGLPTVGERIAMRLAVRALENDDDQALRLLMSYSHNPTMQEQIDRDRVKAGIGARQSVDVTVSREDAAVMDEVRRLMEGTPDEDGAADGIPISDGAPGGVRPDAGLHEADGAAQPLDQGHAAGDGRPDASGAPRQL